MEHEGIPVHIDIPDDTERFLRYEGARELLQQVGSEANFSAQRVTKISKGENNAIFILEDPDGKKVVSKFYQRDDKTRLDREYRANVFLSARGFSVAQPIIRNDQHQYGVYSFEAGDSKTAHEATAEDIDYLADFLVRLQHYKPSDLTEAFPRATSAMVNLQEVLADNARRIASFRDALTQGTAHSLVAELLADASYAEDVGRMTDAVLAQSRNTTWHVVSEDQRLSPVDFGFHNALFRKDKPPVILDLEYFGWDDPLRPVADFIAHDQTLGLSQELRTRFVQQYGDGTGLSQQERERLQDLIKLTDIKWIAIYLHSLTQKYLDARSFAIGGSFDAERYIRQQIQKIEKRKESVSRLL